MKQTDGCSEAANNSEISKHDKAIRAIFETLAIRWQAN